MITTKIFALSLLLCGPFAHARIQLSSHIEIDRPLREIKQSLRTETELSIEESVIIFKSNGLRIESSLLAEKSDMAHIQFSFYLESVNGDYDFLIAPVVIARYSEEAMVNFKQSNNGEEIESLSVSVIAIPLE